MSAEAGLTLRYVLRTGTFTAVCSYCLFLVSSVDVMGRTQEPPINQWCPVMPEEPVDAKYTLEYEGKTIAFCCEKCVTKFLANPERYRSRLEDVGAPVAGAPLETSAEVSRDDSDRPANGIEGLGRFHPLIVHFPVAGIPLALIGLCIWLATKQPAFAAADLPPLIVATIAAIAAVLTGNIAGGSGSFAPTLQPYLRFHQYTGICLMILTLGLSGIRLWRWGRLSGRWLRIYVSGLILGSLLAAISGFLGGALVFGPAHLWR